MVHLFQMYSDIQRANCGEIANTAGSWVHTELTEPLVLVHTALHFPIPQALKLGLADTISQR